MTLLSEPRTPEADSADQPEAQAPARGRFNGFGYRYGIIFVWAVIFILFSILLPESFLTTNNLAAMLSSQASLILLSLSVLPVLAAGEIDLSIAGVMTIAATTVGQLNGVWKIDIFVSILVALAISVLIGLINGLLTIKVGVASIIVTLGMSTLLVGLSVWLSNTLTITGVSSELGKFVNTKVLGVNLAFWISIAIGIVLWYIYRHTALGRHIVFIGKNAEVARLSGLPVAKLKLGAFIVTSFLAGLSGVMVVAIAGGLQPTSLQTLLLPAFAGAFLGSAIIDPGSNNPLGTIIAVLFLATGINGLVLLGADSWVNNVFYGAAVILAVTFSRVIYVRARKKNIV
jgi:ribose transport system permease protein